MAVVTYQTKRRCHRCGWQVLPRFAGVPQENELHTNPLTTVGCAGGIEGSSSLSWSTVITVDVPGYLHGPHLLPWLS